MLAESLINDGTALVLWVAELMHSSGVACRTGDHVARGAVTDLRNANRIDDIVLRSGSFKSVSCHR